jgi:hypothetical protein
MHTNAQVRIRMFSWCADLVDHGSCTLGVLERVCGDLLWGREDMVNKSKVIIMGMVGVSWICW